MTVPLWTLLGFAVWTLVLLIGTVGIYRWRRVLTGRASLVEFPADRVEGDDFYKRAMRAHANCVENLPVFGAVVFAVYASGLTGDKVDLLCVAVLVARITQSLIHVGVEQNSPVIAVRFVFFIMQPICCLWLAGLIVQHAL